MFSHSLGLPSLEIFGEISYYTPPISLQQRFQAAF